MNYCKITLVGNVGYVGELKILGSEYKVLNFSVAHNQGSKTKSGEYETETTWYKCTIWGDRALKLSEKMNKGDKILVSGTPTMKEYEGKTYPEISIDSYQLDRGKDNPQFTTQDIPF